MHLVYAMQKGKIPKAGKAGKAADEMNPEDVRDFLMQECGMQECGMHAKQRILKVLKALKGNNKLQEDDQQSSNVIASTKTSHGDFKSTLKMYRGFEFTPKENQAIQNFSVKPVAHDRFKVQYSKSDDFTNNSTIVVKKLREPTGQFVYVALIKVRGGEDKPEELPAEQPSERPPQEPATQAGQLPLKEIETNVAGDEIKIIKSIPIDDQEGSEILTNFLQAVYRTKA